MCETCGGTCETFLEFCFRLIDRVLRRRGLSDELVLEQWEDEGGSLSSKGKGWDAAGVEGILVAIAEDLARRFPAHEYRRILASAQIALYRAAEESWAIKNGLMGMRDSAELSPVREVWIGDKIAQWGLAALAAPAEPTKDFEDKTYRGEHDKG